MGFGVVRRGPLGIVCLKDLTADVTPYHTRCYTILRVNPMHYPFLGSIVVPFWGSYLESYKVNPKRNYFGAYGYSP